MKSLSIKQQLLIIIIIPLIGIGYFLSDSIILNNKQKDNVDNLVVYLKFTIKISNLIHHLQIERGLSSGYISSNGIKFKDSLKTQRKKVNDIYENINHYIKEQNKKNNFIKKIKDDKLLIYREEIDLLKIDANKQVKNYTEIIGKLIDTIKYINTLSYTTEVSGLSLAYINIVIAKEQAGRERALVNKMFSSGIFLTDDIKRFSILYASQDNYINTFKSLVDKDMIDYYNLKLNTINSKKVNKIRDMIFDKSKKNHILSNMRAVSGYGGLIHSFKNYLLRGEKDDYNNFITKYKILENLIKEYKKFPYIQGEEILLDIIYQTFKKYYDNIIKISNYNHSKFKIKDIDSVVKIDDEQAINALNVLSNEILILDSIRWFELSTNKINDLKDVEDKLSSVLLSKMNSISIELSMIMRLKFLFIFILIFAILVINYFVFKNIMFQILIFKKGLLKFFKYLNKETSTIIPLDDKSDTEIGNMAKIINNSINKTKQNFDALDIKTKELNELNENLENKINDAVSELEQQHEEHQKDIEKSTKFLTIGQMAAGITHEINTPLTYIKGTMEMSKYDLEDMPNNEFKQRLLEDNEKVSDGIKRMSIIVESMREMAQISSNEKEDSNIYATVITVLQMIYNRSKHITNIYVNDELFKLETSDKNKYSFILPIHKQRIEQVWTIVLNNALDELVKIDNFDNRKLYITISNKNKKVEIKFCDNAGGIPSSIINDIFEPFVSTKEASGIGIGLNVAKKIVDEHNGIIEASNITDGACFKIYL